MRKKRKKKVKSIKVYIEKGKRNKTTTKKNEHIKRGESNNVEEKEKYGKYNKSHELNTS